MFTNYVNRVHLSLVNDPLVLKVSIAKCGIRIGPMSLVSVPTHNSGNDFATIDLFDTMTPFAVDARAWSRLQLVDARYL